MISSNVVLTEEHLKRVRDKLLSVDAFVFDVETVGDDRGEPMRNQVTWTSISTYGMTVAIPTGHPNGDRLISPATRKMNKVTRKYDMFKAVYDDPPKQLRPSVVWDILRPVFTSPDITKIAQNATFDLLSVEKYLSCPVSRPYEDTIVQAWLLDENRRLGLGELVKRYYGRDFKEDTGRRVEIHPFSKVARYAYLDAKYEWILWRNFREMIKAEGLERVYELEMDVLEVLIDIGRGGVPVDVDEMRRIEVELSKTVIEIECRMYKEAGKRFNINSNPQKQQIMYGPKKEGGQGLKPWRLTKGALDRQKTAEKEGRTFKPVMSDYSTDREALERFPTNKVAQTLLEYQENNRVLTTYIQGYLGNEKEPSLIYDGLVYPTFVQYGTVTGRFSCVAADTLIETPRDLSKHPDGIPISDMKAGDWVYAFDHQRQLVLRKIKWVGQTGVKQTLVVTLENSDGHHLILRLTPEHLVMLRHGDWRPAANLLHAPGELSRSLPRSVMTMVRRGISDGYVLFFPNAQAKGNGTGAGGRNREHRWIMSQVLGKNLSTKYDVDHIDGNKMNNHPDNLRYVPSLEHRGNKVDFAWGTEQPEVNIYSGRLDYRAISISPGPIEPVWDMEVEEVHNFIANGICVHNCRAPNLQNIPRPGTDLGKKVRALFPALPGHKEIVADYGQIELVVLAHFAGPGALWDGFFLGIDPHTMTAALVFGVAPEDVTKVMRQIAKNINFAIVYGAGPDKVASMSKTSVREAKGFLARHEHEFPEIYAFKDKVIANCKSRKPPYIQTILGRKRRLPTIMASDWGEKGRAERQAVNSLIQGSSADLIKLAMVEAHRELTSTGAGRILLTVHDELVIMTPDDRAEEGASILEEAMTGEKIQSLCRIPLKVDMKIVERWSDAK